MASRSKRDGQTLLVFRVLVVMTTCVLVAFFCLAADVRAEPQAVRIVGPSVDGASPALRPVASSGRAVRGGRVPRTAEVQPPGSENGAPGTLRWWHHGGGWPAVAGTAMVASAPAT